MEHLTLKEVRLLTLFAQGLLTLPTQPARQSVVKEVVQRLGVLQIDTINIVARSPYLVMWSRVGDYDPEWLNNLLEEKQIFEGWAHAASFLPMEDFPLHRRFVLEKKHVSWHQQWYLEHKDESDAVLAHIKENGPVRSSDFKQPEGQRGGTWWDWKVEKRALEYWFAAGELMIQRRVNFQRVYDLTERVMPDWKDSDTPDNATANRELVIRSIKAMGFVLPGWVADYYRLSKKDAIQALDYLVDQEELIEIKVENWNEIGWADPEVYTAFREAIQNNPDPHFSTPLAPFDSLIWDRTRTRALFDFDFSIECYLPQAKRKYGYYLLPLLYNGELIGRMDAKANRQQKRFEVISLYLEPGIKVTNELAQSLYEGLKRCAIWHNTPELEIIHCDSAKLSNKITEIYSEIAD